MALTYRFYRADRIGDGLTKATAFRSALCDYIVEDGSGATFHDELMSGTARYALAYCESAVHTQIAKDNRIQPVGPEFSNVAAITALLDSDAQTALPVPIKNRLIADGRPIVGTVRETLAFVLRAVSKEFLDL